MTNNLPRAVPKVTYGEVRGGSGTREKMYYRLRVSAALRAEISHDFADKFIIITQHRTKTRSKLS